MRQDPDSMRCARAVWRPGCRCSIQGYTVITEVVSDPSSAVQGSIGGDRRQNGKAARTGQAGNFKEHATANEARLSGSVHFQFSECGLVFRILFAGSGRRFSNGTMRLPQSDFGEIDRLRETQIDLNTAGESGKALHFSPTPKHLPKNGERAGFNLSHIRFLTGDLKRALASVVGACRRLSVRFPAHIHVAVCSI